VTTPVPTDSWRTKYFDSLAALNEERARFAAIQRALQRVAGRLCSAALGQSDELDAQIKALQAVLRAEPTAEALDALIPALTDAIRHLDLQPRESESAPRPIDDAVVRAIAAILAELRRDPDLEADIAALDARLKRLPATELPMALLAVSELVEQRIQHIERAKREVETLLEQMVEKLDEINHYLAEQRHDHHESQASSETLKVQITGEVQALGRYVADAGDLQQLREQVSERIAAIDQCLQEFRERETALAKSFRARHEQMSARIAQLEAEAHRLQHELKDEQRQSLIDPLTRVANRLAYERRIQDELYRHRRFAQPVCLAVWDIDHFKRINDSYGHRAGDRVLQAAAECLVKRLREADFIARYGGEEFVMLLPGTALDDALRVCEELRIAVTQIGSHYRGTPVPVTVSAGITSLLPSDTPDSAFDRADRALYIAKQKGRNRIEPG
jgi:diguanylate cyclase